MLCTDNLPNFSEKDPLVGKLADDAVAVADVAEYPAVPDVMSVARAPHPLPFQVGANGIKGSTSPTHSLQYTRPHIHRPIYPIARYPPSELFRHPNLPKTPLTLLRLNANEESSACNGFSYTLSSLLRFSSARVALLSFPLLHRFLLPSIRP